MKREINVHEITLRAMMREHANNSVRKKQRILDVVRPDPAERSAMRTIVFRFGATQLSAEVPVDLVSTDLIKVLVSCT